MAFPEELPSAVAGFLPEGRTSSEIERELSTATGCRRTLIALSREEMLGADPDLASGLRFDIELHMHEEFPEEVGHRWFLTRGLFEPSHEGTVIAGNMLISALPSSDDSHTYLCNVFVSGRDGTIRPLDNPVWTETACLADAILKCLGDEPHAIGLLGHLEVVSEQASDCDLDLSILCDGIGITADELAGMCREAYRAPDIRTQPGAIALYDIATDVAEHLLDPYGVADSAEAWQTPGEAWDEAVHTIELQLMTPSGRQSVLKGLRAELDDGAIDGDALGALSERIHGLGPVAGFPLGQTTVTHGFMVTDYARATLDPYEQDALADALSEVLSEEYSPEEVGRLVEDALDSRIADISCMDAAGFINRLREEDDAWRRSADPIESQSFFRRVPDVGI
ncbi:MAG: hypothetical protein IJH87_02025, partial [Atopobiaceae bacterium]|nr:hypothetical protein [Atopobiaceae bacterium]